MADQTSPAETQNLRIQTFADEGLATSPSNSIATPLLFGGAITIGFYALIPFLPVQRELAQRYFCSHPLEYTTTTLFFIGMAVIVLKAMRLPRERQALSVDLLGDPQLGKTRNSERRAHIVGEHLEQMGERYENSVLVRRLRDVCAFIRGRRSAEGLDDHLKYLADTEADRLHESYGLVRTITWAVPILGFLGTVIGITMAIAEVTPEQLDTSLGTVTGGLAVAFDTTALALALSLVMVFSSSFMQQAEERVLAEVESYGVTRIEVVFPPEKSPIEDAQEQSAELLLDKTERLIQAQNEIWRESLEAMRTRWLKTLDEQRRDFASLIQTGAKATLSDHAEQLNELRQQLVSANAEIANKFTDGVKGLAQAQSAVPAEWTRQLGALLMETRQQDAAAEQARLGELSRLAGQFDSGVQTLAKAQSGLPAEWSSKLNEVLANTRQKDEQAEKARMAELTRLASQIDEGAKTLIKLQKGLPSEWSSQLNTALSQTRQQDEAAAQAGRTQFAEAIQSVTAVLSEWRDAMDAGSAAAGQQLVEIQTQTEAIVSLTGEQNQLTQLEARLAENLEAVRSSQAFEETLLSLNAAVNLLTARVERKAA